jgi:hypothetical protein
MCGSRLVEVVFVRCHVVVVFARRHVPVIFVQRCMAVALHCGLRIALHGGCLLCGIVWRCAGIVFMRHCAGVVFVWYCIGVVWGGCHLCKALRGGRLYAASHCVAGVFTWHCIAQASSSHGVARVLSSRSVAQCRLHVVSRGCRLRTELCGGVFALPGGCHRAASLHMPLHGCCLRVAVVVRALSSVSSWSLSLPGR